MLLLFVAKKRIPSRLPRRKMALRDALRTRSGTPSPPSPARLRGLGAGRSAESGVNAFLAIFYGNRRI